jgi:hypothetical protein
VIVGLLTSKVTSVIFVGSAIGEKFTLKVVPPRKAAPVSVNWSELEVPVLSDFTTIIKGSGLGNSKNVTGVNIVILYAKSSKPTASNLLPSETIVIKLKSLERVG